jgi:preprotein translocase subunit SecG
MSIYEYIIGGILILSSLLIIFVVLLQEGRQANVGVISGAADSFLDKGAARTLDQKLAKWTKYIAIAFFVLVLAGMLVTKFLSKNAIAQREANKAAATATTTTTTVASTTGASTTATTGSTTAAATTTTTAAAK